MANSSYSKEFWHVAKNISNNFTSTSSLPLLTSDVWTAVTPFSKAGLLALAYPNNFTLGDSGHIPTADPPSDLTMLQAEFFNNVVFYALLGLNLWKVYGSDGVHPIVLKNCVSLLTHCLVQSFVSFWLCMSFLPAVSKPTFNLCLRRVIAPIPPATAL